ncbi:MAG: hypothetical protein PVJ39_04875 [Gammaproteobacteria bacterium]|jgi:hypothetical protein
MKRVYQSIIDKGDGDCTRAAVASILDLSLEQVPHFIRYGDDWFFFFLHFMGYFGFSYAGNCDIKSTRGLREEDSVNGCFLATVPSSLFEDGTHSVVLDVNGIIVHDPNPNKLYLGKTKEDANVMYWHMFEPFDENNITGSNKQFEEPLSNPCQFPSVRRLRRRLGSYGTRYGVEQPITSLSLSRLSPNGSENA